MDYGDFGHAVGTLFCLVEVMLGTTETYGSGSKANQRRLKTLRSMIPLKGTGFDPRP